MIELKNYSFSYDGKKQILNNINLKIKQGEFVAVTGLSGCGTALLYIVMVFCIFGALASFIQGEVGIGISGLIIGFLFSPYGLPMIGATVIAFIELINEKIKAL